MLAEGPLLVVRDLSVAFRQGQRETLERRRLEGGHATFDDCVADLLRDSGDA